MRKQTKRIISMMLAVIMLFQLSGITQMDVFATEVEMESTSIVENDAEILYEDESQREEYSKRYRLSDGTWIAVVYDDAVHYQKDGEWKEINNTLKQEAESYTIPVERGKITGEYTVSGFVRSADGEPKVEPMDNILPEQSEEPEVSATPVPVETPMVTETLEPSEEPEVTVEPTEEPVVTETPDAVITVEVEEEPSEAVDEDPVIAPEITEMPEIEEIPAVEETPTLETETPVIDSEPITENTEVELKPIVSPEISLEPIKPVFKDVTEQMWSNTANNFGISLPTKLDGDSRVHVSSEGYDLYFAPVLENETADGDASLLALPKETAVAAEVLSLDKAATDDRVQKLEVKARSGLSYEDVLPGVDLQYLLQSRALKETIVIERADNIPDTIGYTISAEGLTPVVHEDNSIDFVAGEEVIFCFPAPYMFDSANEYSYDIDVTLQALDNGEYLLTYVLDAEWLADAERVWPVSIDPVVNTPTTAANVQDTYINENSPSSNFYNYTSCYVAKLGTKRVRSLIHFDDMPTLTTSDVVLNAYLYMHGKGATSGGSIPVGAYAITAPWTSSTVTWNNQPAHETEALDYQIVNSSNWAQYFCWDVTGAVSRWYVSTLQTGETEPSLKLPNYGIMLKTSLESINTQMQADFGTSEDLNGLVPQLIITYTSNSGIESFWDYTTQDVGRAGTVSVNNFTGNLMVSRTDMSYGGNLMPADMTFHYNYADNRIKLGYGVGWRMNYAQTITARTSTVNGATYSYYQWIDGDGTRRNFNLNNGVWEDETGQGYKLTINADTAESKYIIRDKENNRLGFDINGRLIKIVDGKNSGNYVFITYNAANSTDLRIKEVRDGAGRKYSFTYTTGSSGVSRLSSIVYKGTGTTALNTVSYTYLSTGVLEKVTYNDGGQATYGYANDSTATAFITTVNNPVNGESVSVEYTGSTSNRYSISRVKKLTYKDGATVVSSASFVYGKNYTKVTDQQGCWCMYQFNDFGNTTSVYNDRGQAVFGKYAQDENSSNRANQLTSSSRLQDTVTNLILDPSFEKESSLWVMGNASLDGSVSSTGAKSAKLDNVNEYVSYSFNAVAGTTYTVSAAVKATAGGHIQIEVLQGSSLVKASEPLSSEDWDRLELTFSASGSTTVRFKAVQMSSGVVYLDDVQLEKTSASSRYNLVTDPDMTNAAYWERTLNPQDGTIQSYAVASPANLDQSGLVITASPDTYKFVQQRITIPDGQSGDRYTFGVWVKSASVPLDNGRYPGDTAERRCGIKVKAMKDGAEVASETVLINDSCKEWQYICGSLDTDEIYDSILVCLLFDYGYNNAIFDGVQLFRENFGYHYEYDDNGNVTTITDVAGNKTTYTYGNGNSDVTKIKLPDGKQYTYSYDTSRRLTQTTTPSGVKTTNGYDGSGNITSVTISGNGTTQSIVSGSTYEGNGNMTKTVTTADRQTITYGNNLNKSLVDSVTDPKGQVTNYGYETNTDRLTSVSRNGSTLTYGYTADAVNTIAHSGGSGTTYTFSYGVADILSSVKAGSTTLVTNAYNDFIWNLASQTYANGNVWSYEYYTDKNGHQTTELKYKSTTAANGTALKYVYYYSNEGAVGRIEYFEGTTLKQVEKYYYDTSDRLCRVVGTNGATTPALLYEYSWTYDNNNNVTAVTEKIGNTSTQYGYSYNNEQQPATASYGSTTKTFGYDNYGRGNGETVKNGGTTALNTTWSYKTNGSYMTNQVGGYTNAWNGDSETLSYKYDANGNIIEISGGLNVTYAYDANDQLTLEKNTTANKAWGYTYDSGGNITKKTIYTNASANVIASEVSYTYDTTWGDKLTKVGPESVISDASGNITAYNDWTYTWQGGRQLANAESPESTVYEFSYNDSGLRIGKTEKVNGVVTEQHTYTYNGSLLASDVTSSYGLYFRYDQNGSPIGFAHVTNNTATEYYYVKNLQGDITRIVNSSGKEVASYTYDAWGNHLSQPTSGVGALNPLRYRGYQYDTESGLYYLQSRYYSPEIGRFISADAYAMTYETPIGANMFAYCGNNPVMNIDPSGDVFGTVFDIVSLGYSIYQAAKNPDDPMAKLAVVADAASLLLPAVSGGGTAVRAAARAEKVVETTKLSTKAVDNSLSNARRSAVRQAWKNEVKLVRETGVGSRLWSDNEIVELLSTGKVKGYVGHHMKSVKGYPELAGDPLNIQFLTPKEHLAAHGGNWRNITHGRYVP